MQMMDHAPPADAGGEKKSRSMAERARRAMTLQAKGSCWYCDRLVDSVRRFCSVSCREDYFDEESESN
jgi:hypothetical protein